jgi:hypothetical protein
MAQAPYTLKRCSLSPPDSKEAQAWNAEILIFQIADGILFA